MDFGRLKLLILDVDGVLTSGQVVFDGASDDSRVFFVQDGCAIKAWQGHGGTTAVISGRSSPAVEQRAAQLGIQHVVQGVEDKLAAYDRILAKLSLDDDRVCYVGDDLPDLGPMGRCILPVAVYNAAPAVKRRAEYVTTKPGGAGAVAELIELILRKQGKWLKVEPLTLNLRP